MWRWALMCFMRLDQVPRFIYFYFWSITLSNRHKLYSVEFFWSGCSGLSSMRLLLSGVPLLPFFGPLDLGRTPDVYVSEGVRCTRVKVIRVEVSQNVVHARTTGWMTSTRAGKGRDFGLQPRRSNPRKGTCFELSEWKALGSWTLEVRLSAILFW